MERTVEVRWFSEGRPPASLVEWFDELHADEERRIDSYLRLFETDALGVKLRDGGAKLEVKLQEHDLGRREFASGVAGDVGRWQKWSFPSRPIAGLGLPSECWLEVTKVRRLATYELASSGTVSLVDHLAADGCHVEVTKLLVGGAHWWTVGFEAFGSAEDPFGGLAGAVDAFFSQKSFVDELESARSYAYPAWLRTLK